MMASLEFGVDASDSQASSVGRKRAYHFMNAEEQDVTIAGDDSSDGVDHLAKRAMNASAAEATSSSDYIPSTATANITDIDCEGSATSQNNQTEEQTTQYHINDESNPLIPNVVPSPVSWNKGVPGII